MAKIPVLPLSTLVVVVAAVVLYQLDTFDPAPYPDHELNRHNGPPLFAPNQNAHMLRGSEKFGDGQLSGPEDIAYEPRTGVVYTGCVDGWVSRAALPNGSGSESVVVEKWVNTGGRPLGIAHGLHSEVIVADAYKGLLNISRDGVIELLTDEAEGLKFKLTDAVDIGPDGTLYFTDASFKHGFKEYKLDFLEGRPHGRFLSYDPSTKQTKVLVKDLYFANGVAVSADQSFVIFCETAVMRCKKYYIKGPRKGNVDIFVENLPGLPDNIRYDGEGQYWIALSTEAYSWKLLQRYPFVRKVVAILERYSIRLPRTEKNGGVIAVDLDGNPTAHYCDPNVVFISSGIKIGEHLYCGNLAYPYIIRLNLSQYPATPAA